VRPASPFLASWVGACRVHLALARGDLQTAGRWAARPGVQLPPGEAPSYLRDFEYLTLARVYLARGDLARADELLSRLLVAVEEGGRTGRAIEILVLQALVRRAAGETGPALDLLARALRLAAPRGYVRTFLDEGPPLADLLRALAGRQDVGAYAARLLAAFPDTPSPPPSQPLAEPLSERELEVLRLVAGGLTNRQIADRLVIAVSTVKSHTNSIYGKLGVRNRTQAVARARDLDLL
jgi:LuxR family maltose regulon positive regulatory protein